MIYSSCIVISLLVHQYSTSAEDEMESLRKDILESIKGGGRLWLAWKRMGETDVTKQ